MKNTFHAFGVVSLAVLMLGSQTGCKRLAERLAAQAADAGALGAGGGTEEEADHDEALDGLVDCLNGLDHSISNSLDRYTSWLPDEKDGKQPGPTGKERNVYGLYEIHDSSVKSCEKGLKAASAKPEFKDVAAKYQGVIDKLVPEMNAAYKYYDRDEYKDDGFAKAKEIHGKLWPIAEEYQKVSKEFRGAVVKANDARMAAQIKEVEAKHGRNLIFQKLNVMQVAKNAISVATDEKASLADLEAVTTAYEKALTEMDEYAKAHKEEADKVMMWSSFDSEAEGYLKALKERLRRVRDKKAYSRSEIMQLNGSAGWMVEGSPDKVSREYNELVNRSNSLRF